MYNNIYGCIVCTHIQNFISLSYKKSVSVHFLLFLLWTPFFGFHVTGLLFPKNKIYIQIVLVRNGYRYLRMTRAKLRFVVCHQAFT